AASSFCAHGEAQIIEKGRDVVVALVDLVPNVAPSSGSQVAFDERGLACSGRRGNPSDRRGGSEIHLAKQPLALVCSTQARSSRLRRSYMRSERSCCCRLGSSQAVGRRL